MLLGQGCATSESEEEWLQLFNGQDLTGWQPKVTNYPLCENPNNLFRVEDGLLKVRYSKQDTFRNEFGHLFYKESFENYRLRVEYRFVGQQLLNAPEWAYKNNGLMIHGQPAESMLIDQAFPISLEVQLLGADIGVDRPTGNLCTPGTSIEIAGQRVIEHCINSRGPSISDDSWVTAEVIVYADSLIQHLINGDTVMTYTNPTIDSTEVDYITSQSLKSLNLTSGSISIQAETHPIDFRRVELLELE